MENSTEFEKLQEIIADVLNLDAKDITMDSKIQDDLGADSLDVFQIIVGIEDVFDLEIDNDEVEKIGIEKAKEAINYADVMLIVLDATSPLTDEDKEILKFANNKNTIVVINKCETNKKLDLSEYNFKHIIEVSALQKLGIEELKNEVYNLVIDENIVNSNLMITNLRHVEAIKKAIGYANDAINGIKQGITLDVVSIDLKNLWLSLGEITGNNNNESIINEIFSGFCVGK